jgi:hypothetical protein
VAHAGSKHTEIQVSTERAMMNILTPVAAAVMAGLCQLPASADAGSLKSEFGAWMGDPAGHRNPVLTAGLGAGLLTAAARMRDDDDDDDFDEDDAEERRERAARMRQQNAARAKAAAAAKAAAEAKARAQMKAKAAARQAERRRLSRQEPAPRLPPPPQPPSAPAPSTAAVTLPAVTPVAAPARPRRALSGACKRFVPQAGITMSVPCEE